MICHEDILVWGMIKMTRPRRCSSFRASWIRVDCGDDGSDNEVTSRALIADSNPMGWGWGRGWVTSPIGVCKAMGSRRIAMGI